VGHLVNIERPLFGVFLADSKAPRATGSPVRLSVVFALQSCGGSGAEVYALSENIWCGAISDEKLCGRRVLLWCWTALYPRFCQSSCSIISRSAIHAIDYLGGDPAGKSLVFSGQTAQGRRQPSHALRFEQTDSRLADHGARYLD
jgi:hypothetical protein